MQKQELKNVGLKVTIPRVKILKILEQEINQKHFSAEQVCSILLNDGEDIGLATVYRVLTQFEQVGLVIRHHFDADKSVFELNHGEHHDHIVFLKYGKVDEFFDSVIEKRQQIIATKAGYQLTGHSLHLYGICAKCK